MSLAAFVALHHGIALCAQIDSRSEFAAVAVAVAVLLLSAVDSAEKADPLVLAFATDFSNESAV